MKHVNIIIYSWGFQTVDCFGGLVWMEKMENYFLGLLNVVLNDIADSLCFSKGGSNIIKSWLFHWQLFLFYFNFKGLYIY